MRIATRQSTLALIQAREVQTLLQQLYSFLDIELLPMSSRGDEILDRSLAEIGGKGLFIKTLEASLLKGEADIAVHSLKDIPPTLDPEFKLAAVLPRLSAHDVLVSKKGKLSELPKGAIVGTSSVRRRAELLNLRPDLQTILIRGNVETRIRKMEEGLCDAIILAEAGLKRLGLADRITEVLPFDVFLPSVGQGVIAIEILKDRQELSDLLAPLNDPHTFACITAERAMNAALGASCTSPVGSFAEIKEAELILRGAFFSSDGEIKFEVQETGSAEEALALGARAAKKLMKLIPQERRDSSLIKEDPSVASRQLPY